jgi:RNA polymerase sigma-70 factor (ECF subfamily)
LTVDHSEDLDLVRRMLAGDGAACDLFAERYPRALYRFALSRLAGDRELARDTAQTAMTKALGKLDTYRGDASLFTWLCACCRNEALMAFRARRGVPAAVPIEGDDGEALHDPALERPPGQEAALLAAERAERVHLVLDLLPPQQARALELKYLERLPVREIAGRLGVTAKAAESLLSRGRRAFRTMHERLANERLPSLEACDAR